MALAISCNDAELLAVLAAMAELEAGRYDVACVLGIEQMRNVPGTRAAEYLGAAAWAGREAQDARRYDGFSVGRSDGKTEGRKDVDAPPARHLPGPDTTTTRPEFGPRQ